MENNALQQAPEQKLDQTTVADNTASESASLEGNSQARPDDSSSDSQSSDAVQNLPSVDDIFDMGDSETKDAFNSDKSSNEAGNAEKGSTELDANLGKANPGTSEAQGQEQEQEQSEGDQENAEPNKGNAESNKEKGSKEAQKKNEEPGDSQHWEGGMSQSFSDTENIPPPRPHRMHPQQNQQPLRSTPSPQPTPTPIHQELA